MTALGKILVFFVLILSVVWNALVVNSYVTRTNYKTELEKEQKLRAEAANSANYERKRADESKAASDAVIAQSEATIRLLNGQILLLNANAAKDDAAVAAKLAEKDKENIDNRATLNNNVKTQLNQIELLREGINRLDKLLNDAVIAEQKAKNDSLQAKINETAAQNRADDLEKKLLSATDSLNNSKTGQLGGLGTARIPTTDANFQAHVVSVAGDLVEISLGTNAKLQKGAVLQVWRYTPKAKFVGTLTISSVDPHRATGKFTPLASAASKPTADDLPMKDDIVGVLK